VFVEASDKSASQLGIFGRMRVRAISASKTGSRSPAMRASIMLRAALPVTSVTTESSFTQASSSTFAALDLASVLPTSSCGTW